MTSSKLNDFVFFGTNEFAVIVLEELARTNYKPALIVTTADAPRGRGRVLTPPPVKLWAIKNHIPCDQPDKLKAKKLTKLMKLLKLTKLALVASYGKIIPPEILALPKHGVLNIHPSLLPKFRGPAPIQGAILAGEQETGATIMLLDEQIDHGPILKARSVKLKAQNFIKLNDQLAKLGARLFIEILPKWLAGKIQPMPQNHSEATFTKKIKKEDGLISLTDDPRLNYRKFLAFTPRPGIYYFGSRTFQGKPDFQETRIIITAAHFNTSGQFVIDRVKPEGKKEMLWNDFQRGKKINFSSQIRAGNDASSFPPL